MTFRRFRACQNVRKRQPTGPGRQPARRSEIDKRGRGPEGPCPGQYLRKMIRREMGRWHMSNHPGRPRAGLLAVARNDHVTPTSVYWQDAHAHSCGKERPCTTYPDDPAVPARRGPWNGDRLDRHLPRIGMTVPSWIPPGARGPGRGRDLQRGAGGGQRHQRRPRRMSTTWSGPTRTARSLQGAPIKTRA